MVDLRDRGSLTLFFFEVCYKSNVGNANNEIIFL